MPRDVDEKKTRKALRKLRKAKERAEADGIELTEWEQEFVEGVDERLTKYGSAFADPSLGSTEEALSIAQSEILRQLDKKSRGKGGNGFTTRKPLKAKKGLDRPAPRVRQLDDDLPETPETTQENDTEPSVPYTENLPKFRIFDGLSPEAKKSPAETDCTSQKKRIFRVIDGGKSGD